MTDYNELEKLSIFLRTKAESYRTAKSYVTGKKAEKFEQICRDYIRFDCILVDYLNIIKTSFITRKEENE